MKTFRTLLVFYVLHHIFDSIKCRFFPRDIYFILFMKFKLVRFTNSKLRRVDFTIIITNATFRMQCSVLQNKLKVRYFVLINLNLSLFYNEYSKHL